MTGVERHLGVDRYAPAAGEVHDEVWRGGELLALAGEVRLGIEVEMLGEVWRTSCSCWFTTPVTSLCSAPLSPCWSTRICWMARCSSARAGVEAAPRRAVSPE